MSAPASTKAQLDPMQSITAVAELIKSGKAKRITLLTGAGASVASGIPDFRSPGGMYDTLKPELLTAEKSDQKVMKHDPTHVVNKALFMRNQFPYHEVRRPFIVGTMDRKWKPTIAQMFVRLLHDNGLLTRLYTQNIDGLDFDVGLPTDKIVCVHGSIRQTICESCNQDPYDGDYAAYVDEVRKNIKDIYGVDEAAPETSTNISCRKCGKPTVKPSTVLYGGSMPDEFFAKQDEDLRKKDSASDLMFVIGSSLTVFPAAGLPGAAPKSCTRVLVNREAAGQFDFYGRDYWMKGECDSMILELVCQLGWLDQLVALQGGLCPTSAAAVASAVGNGGRSSTAPKKEKSHMDIVVDLVKSGKAKRVTLLTGAGASVASGIPDFRSPGGMYDTLKPELLTAEERDRFLMQSNPTYVVTKDLFMRNQFPYHEVRRPFIVGTMDRKWKPTIAQMFVRLLHDNGLLTRLYTQNIDGLDFDVGLPTDKIVCVHGSIRQTICESCNQDPYDGDYAAYVDEVRKNIKDIYGVDEAAPETSTNISCRKCGKPTVKPSTVLYGGSMPKAFFDCESADLGQPETAGTNSDLMFVIGSSLTVFPAAGLPGAAPPSCTRVLVNNENVGDFEFENALGVDNFVQRDHWLQGECDTQLLELITRLGWLDQLVALQDGMCPSSQKAVAAAAGGGGHKAPVAGGGKRHLSNDEVANL